MWCNTYRRHGPRCSESLWWWGPTPVSMCGKQTTWSSPWNLLLHPSYAARDFWAVVNLSERRMSCCDGRVWKATENCWTVHNSIIFCTAETLGSCHYKTKIRHNFSILWQFLYLCQDLRYKVFHMKQTTTNSTADTAYQGQLFRKRGHAWTRLSSIDRRVDSITNPPTAMNVNREPCSGRGLSRASFSQGTRDKEAIILTLWNRWIGAHIRLLMKCRDEPLHRPVSIACSVQSKCVFCLPAAYGSWLVVFYLRFIEQVIPTLINLQSN